MSTDPQQIAAMAKDLPPFPGIAWEVMQLVKRPDSSAADLERVVAKDVALTARVLKISNSALYGLRGTITTLSRAVVILGMKTLQSLVIAASSESLYRTRNFKDKLLWDHSLAVALVARLLALRVHRAKTEEAFVAGLLHDIGKTVLDLNLGDSYQDVIQQVYNDGVSFIQAERQLLGVDHAEVGATVVRKWNFSPILQEAVRCHHAPSHAEVEPRLCAVVSLANGICVRRGIGPERDPELDLSGMEASQMLQLSESTIEELMEELDEKLAAEKGMMGGG